MEDVRIPYYPYRTVINSSPKFLDEFLQEGFKGHLTWLVNFRIPPQKPNLFGESAHNEYIFSLAGKNVASALLYWLKVEISIGLLLTSGYSWMYPCPTYPYGKSLYKPYITWVFMGDNFQEYKKNKKNTMGTYTVGGYNQFPLINEEVYVVCFQKIGGKPLKWMVKIMENPH